MSSISPALPPENTPPPFAAYAICYTHPQVVHTYAARATKITGDFHDRTWGGSDDGARFACGVRSGAVGPAVAARVLTAAEVLALSVSGAVAEGAVTTVGTR